MEGADFEQQAKAREGLLELLSRDVRRQSSDPQRGLGQRPLEKDDFALICEEATINDRNTQAKQD